MCFVNLTGLQGTGICEGGTSHEPPSSIVVGPFSTDGTYCGKGFPIKDATARSSMIAVGSVWVQSISSSYISFPTNFFLLLQR